MLELSFPNLQTLFPAGWRHYLLGGLSIGVGVALLYLSTGRVGGMSTVYTSTWSWLLRRPYFQQPRFVTTRRWRLIYAAGLLLGAALWWQGWAGGAPQTTQVPAWQLALGGLLAGYGARRANGCTSGHGICGLGSLQWPSALAVLTFMVTAAVTAQLMAAVRA